MVLSKDGSIVHWEWQVGPALFQGQGNKRNSGLTGSAEQTLEVSKMRNSVLILLLAIPSARSISSAAKIFHPGSLISARCSLFPLRLLSFRSTTSTVSTPSQFAAYDLEVPFTDCSLDLFPFRLDFIIAT